MTYACLSCQSIWLAGLNNMIMSNIEDLSAIMIIVHYYYFDNNGCDIWYFENEFCHHHRPVSVQQWLELSILDLVSTMRTAQRKEISYPTSYQLRYDQPILPISCNVWRARIPVILLLHWASRYNLWNLLFEREAFSRCCTFSRPYISPGYYFSSAYVCLTLSDLKFKD